MAKTLEELRIGTYRDIAVVRTSTPIYVALGIFVQQRVSALPVVDEAGREEAQRAPPPPPPSPKRRLEVPSPARDWPRGCLSPQGLLLALLSSLLRAGGGYLLQIRRYREYGEGCGGRGGGGWGDEGPRCVPNPSPCPRTWQPRRPTTTWT